ncbi:HpcH/HpaI aldolase family protein [Saccharopolyspora gregorii]|uniref:HpcH/HpaI aldolase/citrate lyase domain-containing protein n=1 Tax=Saccharopolyspora gregorii TaxID=33914 RepID=A0ABP6RLP7_9PSEU|nr:aldolase/citrate lyase family protein [Saccharopolyspora gregorii]
MKLKARLRAGERLRGGILRLPAEMLVELSGVAELDYVLVDCEHGPDDLVALQQHLALAQAHGLPVLVRVGRADPNQVLRILDLGAEGIVVPHVESAREAEDVVRSAHYPPRGDRGFATYSRAGRFGAVSAAEHLAAAQDVLVIAMVETGPGVERAAEIAAVDGVDAVWVGPADLAVSLGVPPGDAAVGRAKAEVHRQARAAGAAVMSIVSSAGAGAVEDADFVVYNLAHILLTTFREL